MRRTAATGNLFNLQVMKAPGPDGTGTLTLGMTVADFRAPAPDDCTTHVARNLDHAKFWALVVDALERIGEPEA